MPRPVSLMAMATCASLRLTAMSSRPHPSIASTLFSAMFHTTWVIWSASNGNDGTAGSTRTESSTSCARPGSSRIRAPT